MASQDIAAALQRVESILRRRPTAGLHDDASATACWQNGTRVLSRQENGAQILTDMPASWAQGAFATAVALGTLMLPGTGAPRLDSKYLPRTGLFTSATAFDKASSTQAR